MGYEEKRVKMGRGIGAKTRGFLVVSCQNCFFRKKKSCCTFFRVVCFLSYFLISILPGFVFLPNIFFGENPTRNAEE